MPVRTVTASKEAAVAVYFELESRNSLIFVHSDDRIVVLNGKEVARVG